MTTKQNETPTKVFQGKHSGVNVIFEIYGELSDKTIKNFNHVFNDEMDEIDMRNNCK